MGLRRLLKNLRRRRDSARDVEHVVPKDAPSNRQPSEQTVHLMGRPVTAQTREAVQESVRETGLWFVDIPRTSSTSIRAELGRRHGPAYAKANVFEPDARAPQIFEDHIPARDMRWFLGPDLWDGIFTFTVVRNPWDRAFSLYHYMRKAENIPQDWSFDRYMHELDVSDGSEHPFDYHGVRLAAADYILDDDGTVLVDWIVRFEDRAAGLREVASRLEMPELGQLHLQRAKAKDLAYRDHYTPEARRIVEDWFAKDITLFGYDF